MDRQQEMDTSTVADPGFPIGGRGPVRGVWTPDAGAFGENVCENNRIGSRTGWHAPAMPPSKSANDPKL